MGATPGLRGAALKEEMSMNKTEQAALDAAQVRLDRDQEELQTKLWKVIKEFFPDALGAVLFVGERSDFPTPDGRLPLIVSVAAVGSQHVHDDCLKVLVGDIARSGYERLMANIGPKKQ
jgi:hypothetical protein